MKAETQGDTESTVRRLAIKEDRDGAVTAALRGYGPEVLRFLGSSLRSEEDAADVFSVFAEDLWRGLPGFAWECSLRTWVYVLARRASYRTLRRRRREVLPKASPSVVSALVEKVRTETRSYLRTEKRTRLRALRDSLSEEDQALLVLRVDRGLAWDELARVFSEEDLDDAARAREAARLRKRFQLVKEKLKALAKREATDPRRQGEG
jgi:RNA polymerase sigma-70 factor (ECF subfamily)